LRNSLDRPTRAEIDHNILVSQDLWLSMHRLANTASLKDVAKG
jgi:hypothetical protein